MNDKEAEVTTALLKLKVLLTAQRDAKRKEANIISAELRALDKLIAPEMVADLNEYNKLNEPWKTRTQKELAKERQEKKEYLQQINQFLERTAT